MPSNNPFAETITRTIEVLQQAKADAAKILSENAELSSVKLTVTAGIDKPLAQLRSLIGMHVTTITAEAPVLEIKPVKSMFGKPVKERKAVTEEILNPSEQQKNEFLGKRDELYNRFLEMTDEQVFAYANEPNGKIIIRSVAKKSGLDNYKDAALNVLFLEQIRSAIKKQEEKKQAVIIAKESGKKPGNGKSNSK